MRSNFKLSDLLKIKNGKDHKSLSEGNIPVYGSGGLMRLVDEYIYDKPSILLPRKGSLQNIQYANQPFWTVDTLYYTEINEKLTAPYFLYYYLKSLNLENLNTGTGVPSMTFSSYYDLEINLPPLELQKIVAKFLENIDRKIHVNNQINDNLEALAKTIYDYWFVQFDFPDENGKPYKSSGGKMVYNEVLKSDMPKDWEVKKLKNFATTGSGGTPKSTEDSYYVNGKIPWINSGELNNPIIVNTNNYITETGLQNSSAKLFPAETILIAMYGATAGKTSLITFEATTNQAICAIIPNQKELLYYSKFTLDNLYNYLVSLSSGSARDNLSQDKIKELEVVNPLHEILSKHYHLNLSFFEKIKVNLVENQKLMQLRDWLLPMLMNGQVSVK
ncbi:restriction endonuclease subunit S [Chryseobacterium sp. RR2-3-20]|uniref:restriction endonuclease subunit S n=1 Tax=Chryseobacterium sp. RR2-3-20 TaxID=2787626 RepID=UPI0021D42C35|nr:restriction endonuclease subunit S [Chryseobacterium sp. RR2-3-20]